MESVRQRKISSMIQQEMSIILQARSTEFMNKIITVTVVRVSPDLGYAKIYLSIFPEDKKEEVFELIQMNTNNFRYELGNKIRNQIRKIPEIEFYIDDSLDYADKIDQLLKK
jgi:ribosome-binding factor A